MRVLSCLSCPRTAGNAGLPDWAAAAVVLAASALVAAAAPAQTTPAGRWETISDVTGKPDAIVEIREQNGELVGVVKALLDPADDTLAVCDECHDSRKGQRIIGMEILDGMHRDGDAWSGGTILDPETGKSYKATMHLSDDGQKLIVRGYVGLPIFGRSQTWTREKSVVRAP